MRKVLTVLFVIYMLLIPLIKFQIAPRVAISDLAYIVFIMLLSMYTYRLKQIPPRWLIISLIFWLTFTFSGFSIFYSSDFLFEWAGFSYLLSVPLAFVIFSRTSNLSCVSMVHYFSLAYFIALLIGSAGIVLNQITGSFPIFFYEGGVKLVGPFLFPNQYAHFLVTWFPVFYAYSVVKKPHVVKFFLIVLVALNVFATGSRTGSGVFLLELFIMLMFTQNEHIKIRIRSLALAIMFVAGISVMSQTFAKNIWAIERAWLFLTYIKRGEFADSFRMANWSQALYVFWQHPVAGVGLGNFWRLYEKEVHNTFLSVLAETGFLGFLGFILYFSSILYNLVVIFFKNLFYRLIQNRFDSLIIFAVLLSIIASMLFGIQHYILRARHFWAMIGLALTAIETTRSAHVRN